MADNNILRTFKIDGKTFNVNPCWNELGLTKNYMLALLSRDEYTPVAKAQPESTDTLYTDPDSGNPAGFHAGQCVVYPDSEAEGGLGLSIAKSVTLDSQGIPTSVQWYHATDVEKRLAEAERKLAVIIDYFSNGVFGNGEWINQFPWQGSVAWNNGE